MIATYKKNGMSGSIACELEINYTEPTQRLVFAALIDSVELSEGDI